MKEFKFCHEEITEGVEIPVTVCETQTNETTVEMTAEQTQADETAETEPAKTPKEIFE